MANWFESLGLKPGPLHAATRHGHRARHPARAAARVPHAAHVRGRVLAHDRGVPDEPPEERVLPHAARKRATSTSLTIAVLSITLGTLGPGEWSLDDAVDFSFPFDPKKALAHHRDRRHRRRGAVPRSRSGARRSKPTPAADGEAGAGSHGPRHARSRHEAVRRHHRGRRPEPRGRRRGVPRAPRAVGLRQVDRAAHDRRARDARPRARSRSATAS